MKTTVIDLYCLNPRAWLKFICKSTSCMLLHFRADAALQYSPCCVFQSTHKHRAAFPNTVMLCCELSEAWAGG